jgi:hypothetical protein
VNEDGALEGQVVDWTLCATLLQQAQADVVHLMDCGYPVEVADGVAEVVTATAGAENREGWLRALIEELKANKTVMTAAGLHGRLMRREGDGVPFYAVRVDGGRKPAVLMPVDGTVQTTEKREGKDVGKRILVGVSVKENVDVASLKVWLSSNVPDSVEIEVSGVWVNSLMLTVPIEVWTQLPGVSEWVHIAAVEGGNKMLVNKTARVGRGLAIRR